MHTHTHIGASFIISLSHLVCNGPSSQLYNEEFYLSNGIEYVTGIPVLCEDFAIIALCNDGSIYDDPASLFCDALGYESMFIIVFVIIYFSYSDGVSINMNQASYGTLPNGTQYFNNYTCPSDAEHYDNCTANSTTNPNCTNSSFNYVIQCSRPEQSKSYWTLCIWKYLYNVKPQKYIFYAPCIQFFYLKFYFTTTEGKFCRYKDMHI